MGRPKGNGSNTIPNWDYTDSNRASQDNRSRGRSNSGRTVESQRPRESRSRDITAQGEHGHTVPGLEGQVQETVTQSQNSECGSVAASPSNPWDNFAPAPLAVQNTASLNATLDTSRPGEALGIFPQRNPLLQASLDRNELLPDELGVYSQPLWHPTSESELMPLPADDISMFSFDNYLTESGDGPDVAQTTATESTKRAKQPLCQDIDQAPAVLEPASTARAPPETLQPSYPHSPSPQEQYESFLYQLSELHLRLYRLSISAPPKSSQHCPSDHLFSPGSTPSIPAGTAGTDEIFAATETLIEILQHLCHGVLPEQSQDVHPYNFHSQSPQCKLSIDLKNNPNNGTPFSLPAGAESSDTLSNHRPDTATFLLILACYSRLLHIYEPLVTSLRQVLQQSTNHSRSLSGSVPNTSNTLHLYLPAFSLGCFSLAASPDLNIRLLLHLVSHMLERIHRAVQLCVPAETNNNNRPLYASSVGEDPSRHWEARFGPGSGGGFRRQHSSGSPMALAAEIALGEVCERERILVEMLYAVMPP